MKRRISHILDPKAAQVSLDAVATLKLHLLNILKDANVVNPASGQAMGVDGGWDYCQDGCNIAEKLPKLYDSERLDPTHYRDGINLAAFLIALTDELKPITDAIKLAFGLESKDLMDATNYVRGCATEKKDINEDYGKAAVTLNALFDKRVAQAVETRKTNKTISSLEAKLAEYEKNNTPK